MLVGRGSVEEMKGDEEDWSSFERLSVLCEFP